jgi:hypothetical protein
MPTSVEMGLPWVSGSGAGSGEAVLGAAALLAGTEPFLLWAFEAEIVAGGGGGR